MKKLKFLTLAAIAAATAMVSSCSDNVELSTPTKETGNTNDGALVIKASMGDSRVAETTSTGFTGFTLFGIENPPSGNASCFLNGVDGIAYTGSMTGTWSTTSASVAVWPHTESGYTYNFYGLSAGGDADLSESGVSVTDGSNSLLLGGEFRYEAPTMADPDDASVQIPDLSKQKDIIFASDLGTSKGETGVVNLPFKHAFAKVTVDIRFNSSELKLKPNGNATESTTPSSSIADGSVLVIDYIALHNVKVSGNFTFTDGGGTWIVDGDNSTLKYKFNSIRKIIAGTYEDEGLNKDNLFTTVPLIQGDDAFMVIPQELQTWIPAEYTVEDDGDGPYHVPVDDSATEPLGGTYIELHCAAWNIEDSNQQTVMPWDGLTPQQLQKYAFYLSDDDDPHYMTSVYIPLKLSTTSGIQQFEVNKKYNLRLNMVNVRSIWDEALMEGIQFN